jgi:hypothetical protein
MSTTTIGKVQLDLENDVEVGVVDGETIMLIVGSQYEYGNVHLTPDQAVKVVDLLTRAIGQAASARAQAAASAAAAASADG